MIFLYVSREAFRILTQIVGSLFLAPNLLSNIIDVLLDVCILKFCI